MADAARMFVFYIPKNDELIAAIGKVAIYHGQLDHILRMTVKSLLKLSVREAIDGTRRQGSRELRERVRKIAKQKLGEGEALVKLDAILERSKRATERRNELLHSVWGSEIDGDPVVWGDDHTLAPIPSVEQLDALASELAQIRNDLNEARLHGFLFAALNPKAQPVRYDKRACSPPED